MKQTTQVVIAAFVLGGASALVVLIVLRASGVAV